MKCFNKSKIKALYTEMKKILLFSLPFIAIFLLYVLLDPFMVLFNYSDFNQNYQIEKNIDFITTEKYISNSEIVEYDSFIFGSSTSFYISPKTWKKLIHTNKEVFAFFSSAEHIAGIWSKIKFIDSNGDRIKNAVIILDTESIFGNFINNNPLFMKHYKVYPSSKFNFHYLYFLHFANIRYLSRLLIFEITNDYKSYMNGYLNNNYYYFDNLTNEYHNISILEEIKTDSIGYYANRQNRFGNQSKFGLEKSAQINIEYKQMLIDIKEIFLKNNTDYRIIIGPAYNQIQISEEDLDMLNSIFNENKVFDFSGTNEISTKKSNFYDEFHFKKFVGDYLLQSAYDVINK